MSETSSRKAIDRLLRPRSIAIVGASAEPGAPGFRVLANLEAVGFSGDVHLVTRRVAEINGRHCVPTIADLPQGIDAAVLIVPEAAVADAIAGCVERGIGGIALFSAGFAETGDEGRAKQEKIAALAREAGIALEGPNCMGFSNFVDRVSVSFGAVETEIIAAGAQGAAVIAQSGAMMGNIASALGAKGVAVNYTISTGNEAVTSAEDFLEAVLDDPQTQIFVLFLEQIRKPAHFLDLVAKARQLGKPVLLMHPGSTERARESARSHTGALAGDYAVMQTVLRHVGVVQVETMDELIDTATLLARWPKGATKGAAIVSNSGAVRGIALDFCKGTGLDVPKLSAETEAALRPILPTYVPVDNPLDLATAGMGQGDIYGRTARIMLADDNIGCAIMAMVPGTPALQMAKANSLVPLVLEQTRPIAFVIMGDAVPLTTEFDRLIADSRIPFFRSPDRAMRAMAHLYHYGRRLERLESAVTPTASAPPLPGHGSIPEHRAKEFLRAAGIAVPQGALAPNIIQARAIASRLGYPVALKIQSPDIPHKSDVGGVMLGILTPDALDTAWEQMETRVAASCPQAKIEGVLVERMASPGFEMILGARRDRDWGPIVMVGLGGIWTEALEDVRLFPAGLSPDAIVEEIAQLKGAKVLAGVRGAPPLDVAALAETAAKLGAMMLARPELDEIEINPLIVRPRGAGVLALDALMHAH
ncbi:MAG TPA: acetate--CoA ligase family protein [Stellaceae bacterium]|jgi:acyl-CoA synthetase (NDP forming)|nr:acetate--CoA ligase family protein [Stellaceae bacterium]